MVLQWFIKARSSNYWDIKLSRSSFFSFKTKRVKEGNIRVFKEDAETGVKAQGALL